MLDPTKLADEWADYGGQSLPFTITVIHEERDLIVRALRALDDTGMKDDLDSALDVLIRRINGEAPLSTAAEWVRLNYPARAKDLIQAEPASGDVRSRLGKVVARIRVGGMRHSEYITMVLDALHPGDRTGGCVLVPADALAAARRAGAEEMRAAVKRRIALCHIAWFGQVEEGGDPVAIEHMTSAADVILRDVIALPLPGEQG